MLHQIPPVTRAVTRALLRPLKRYHHFEVHGLEHVPRSGAAMIAVHHSLATYDAFLIGDAIIDTVGRSIIGWIGMLP